MELCKGKLASLDQAIDARFGEVNECGNDISGKGFRCSIFIAAVTWLQQVGTYLT